MESMVEIKGKKFTAILREEPEGGYSAQCVELPSIISEGKNRKEALANIKEAVEGYLEAFPEELDQFKRKMELVEITIEPVRKAKAQKRENEHRSLMNVTAGEWIEDFKAGRNEK